MSSVRSSKKRILVIVMGVLFILSLNFFQKEVRGFFYSISSPVQRSLWLAGDGASDFFEGIFQAKNLKKENENIKLKIQELLSGQNYLKELEEENKMLREALGLGLQKEFRLELVEIIGKDTNQDSILINKGSEAGIAKDFLVITPQNVLIGNIAEVFHNYSRVLLISDKSSSLEAKISSSDVSGLAKGLGRYRIYLDFIPKDAEIREGDLVVSKGFLIGLVKEIRRADVSPFQQADISPFFDISNLDKVFIVLD